jgi:acetyl esterase/lipase
MIGKKRNNSLIVWALRPLLIIMAMLYAIQLYSQQLVIPLYKDTAPGSENWNWDEKEVFIPFPINGKMVYNVSKPSLHVFYPDSNHSNGTAVLLIPGGGFHLVNVEHEGYKVARELTSRGLTVFLLKYRVARSLTNDPFNEMMLALTDTANFEQKIAPFRTLALNDAKKAMKYIKGNASFHKVQSNKIGVAGFSAGGVLAVQLAMNEPEETIPDFAAFLYTVFDPTKINVTAKASPAFISCASDDRLAPAMNSINLYTSWMAAGVNAELHIYASGGHGLKNGDAPTWINRFCDWLQQNGFL